MCLISICIPAYKRTVFLGRLLDSIVTQEFRDFEVIITDDSPDETIQLFCAGYSDRLPIQYHKNRRQLGTPENWNESVRLANGKWIKIMHDDDWFSGPESLTKFANAIRHNPDCAFIFSAYTNCFIDRSESQKINLSSWWFARLKKSPLLLFSTNLIGPPSVVIFKKNSSPEFDPGLKWLVDIDFYIRLQARSIPVYIREYLVSVGISDEQVTASCFREPGVEIPESFHLLSKLGPSPFSNPFFYDGWWRLVRNLNIRSTDQIRAAGYQGEVNPKVNKMIRWQNSIPQSLLKIGPVSKTIMFLSYLV